MGGRRFSIFLINVNVRMRHFCRRCLLGTVGLLAAINGQAASRFDNLVANPPFGQSVSPTQARADAPNQPLEFRGISVEQGEKFFSFYDPATKRSRWVTLNEADDGLLLKNYDEAAHTATVDFNGRPLTLILKSGPKFAQSQPAMAPPPGAAVGAPLPGQSAALPGMSTKGQNPEATRLQQIAEEIRRRRALRSQGPQMSMPPQSGQTGGPAGLPQSVPGQGGGPTPVPNATPGQGPVPLPGSTTSGGPVPTQVPQ